MNQRGVTLIELIIVMVIFAIEAVLTTPNISSWLTNYRMRSATRDMGVRFIKMSDRHIQLVRQIFPESD